MKSWKIFFGGQQSLKFFIAASLLGGSIGTFVLVYLVTTTTYQENYVKYSKNIACGISDQVVQSLLHMMVKGWSREQLLSFFDPVVKANAEIPLIISMLRAPSVELDFGKVDAMQPDEAMRQVLESGQPLFEKNRYVIKSIVPVKAQEKCLDCHVNAASGDILGALKVEQDLGPTLFAIIKKFGLLFLVLSPLPVVLAVLIARYTTGKIENSISVLHENIKKVNCVRDLVNVDVTGAKTDFLELNRILSEVDILVRKMKATAVDRQLLEFQVKLLESFVITSDVVRDWRKHVSNILIQFNEVVEAYALFSIFKVGEENYDLEIFWRSRPSEKTSEQFDRIVKQRITEQKHIQIFSTFQFSHTVIDRTLPVIDLKEEDIDLQVKSIFLNHPKIGGIVGIGIQSGVAQDIGMALMIEGVLTTLVNVIGSVRAIYNYTKEMEYYATRDTLTSLYNQRVFWDLSANELQRSKRHNHKFSLLLLDLDNFKMVNDRYGHIYGDIFLQMFAVKIEEFLREGDILTRYGGDEFAAILPETDLTEAYAASLRVLESLKDVVLDAPDGTRIKSTVSIGLAVYPDHSEELNALFMIADNMMYKAKREGKNRVGSPTSEDITRAYRAKDEQALFLLNVLERTEQVVPMFQAIMDINTGSVCMYELLMGIRHEGEILPASSFIETAEKMGIISQLDFIVIEKAFQEVRKKNYQGILFINLSPNSLVLNRYIANVRKLAAEFQLNPANIVFEITERETVRNRALLQKFAGTLKNEGFKFAIDDFGAGFSSFHYLKLFDIDYIKIEGDFVRSISRDFRDKAFVKNVVSLAKDLNIKTIAEYVENEEVFEVVEELGADYAQGYFIGQPSQEIKAL